MIAAHPHNPNHTNNQTTPRWQTTNARYIGQDALVVLELTRFVGHGFLTFHAAWSA